MNAGDPTILWSHALAALLFAMLGAWAVQRDELPVPRRSFAAAACLTALWALAAAGIGPGDPITRVLWLVRDLGWLGFLLMLLRRGPATPQRLALGIVHGVLAGVIAAAIVLTLVETTLAPGTVRASVHNAALVLRMMIALGALVLVHNLHFSAHSAARGRLLLVTLALAGMWFIDLSLLATAFSGGGWPRALVAARGFGVALLAPMLAIGLGRGRDWTVQVSRTIAYQSLGFLTVAAFLLGMGTVTEMLGRLGGNAGRLAQTGFAIGTTAAFLAIAFNPALKAWAKVKLAKHFFQHRYDYRAEWLRFTDTLGRPGEDAAPQAERIVKAVADLTDSPAGLLLVPDGTGLGIGASWNWPARDLPAQGGDESLAVHLTQSGRIIELDAVRADLADPADAAALPQWMQDSAAAWAIVPLLHFDRLAGAILLARPPLARALDWEDFDLLKIAGRQVASYLAEASAHAALADAQRFDEFNRRFAFIVHDIKNLVSQLTLVARNAERHAENPEFRADMIATLQDSAGRMNDLLARLSQHHGGKPELCPVEALQLAQRVANRRRSQHPVLVSGSHDALVQADPARLEQVLGHLVQNAIEASPAHEPVTIAIDAEGASIAIDVIDAGCGMSPAFVRDRLFKPFDSSKPGGFGIGAFEARQLVVSMGGRIEVTSREGEGTRFRIVLPSTRGDLLLEAAA